MREKALVKKVLAPLVMMLFLASIVGVTVPAQACSPKVFTVHPSGGDDTTAIQAAFDAAVAAGPGSMVKLTAGHFYSTNIVVENFRGSPDASALPEGPFAWKKGGPLPGDNGKVHGGLSPRLWPNSLLS
jgi:hypothetical protein